MSTISFDLVRKYIDGEDLENIDSLENDPNFMLSVINASKDLKMYHFCSDEVKQNYEFVKSIVKNFYKVDSDFVSDVADYYLSTSDDDVCKKELTLLLIKLLPMDESFSYRLAMDAHFILDMTLVSACKRHEGEEKFKQEFKEGFIILSSKYSSNETILNYYASKFLDDIIDEHDIDFKFMLLSRYRKSEELELFDVKKFIVDVINGYDSYLADYLILHPFLLDKYSNELNEFIDNFDSYKEEDDRNRAFTAFEMIESYLESYNYDCSFVTVLLKMACCELGIYNYVNKFFNEFVPEPVLEECFYDGEVLSEVMSYRMDDIDDNLHLSMRKSYFEETLPKSLELQAIYENVKRILYEQLYEVRPRLLHEIVREKKKSVIDSNNKCLRYKIDFNN